MTMLPNIPRLYTALAEVLAVLLYARRLPRRFHRQTAVTVWFGLSDTSPASHLCLRSY